MSLKGSQTEQNLKDAFAGESQANRRYLYFAARADVEGYNDIAVVFRSTAEGETGHAHGHLEYLEEAGDPATGLRRLRRGVDRGKDQSYFLFELGQEQLEAASFPVGELSKSQVRERARALGLETADKPESQEICFVPDGDRGFLFAAGGNDGPGPIVDTAGKVLGQHRGLVHYTVGQRRGIGVAASEPLYVLALDAADGADVREVMRQAFDALPTARVEVHRPTLEDVFVELVTGSAHPGEQELELRSTVDPMALEEFELAAGELVIAVVEAFIPKVIATMLTLK